MPNTSILLKIPFEAQCVDGHVPSEFPETPELKHKAGGLASKPTTEDGPASCLSWPLADERSPDWYGSLASVCRAWCVHEPPGVGRPMTHATESFSFVPAVAELSAVPTSASSGYAPFPAGQSSAGCPNSALAGIGCLWDSTLPAVTV